MQTKEGSHGKPVEGLTTSLLFKANLVLSFQIGSCALSNNWGHPHSASEFGPISSYLKSSFQSWWPSDKQPTIYLKRLGCPHHGLAGFNVVQKLVVLFHDAIDFLSGRCTEVTHTVRVSPRERNRMETHQETLNSHRFLKSGLLSVQNFN